LFSLVWFSRRRRRRRRRKKKKAVGAIYCTR